MPLRHLWTHPTALWVAYTMAALIASVQSLWLRSAKSGYTPYENYVIFRNAFAHLAQGLNPYAPYPAEQWDLYKYSPAFAVVMGPFSLLPDAVGLTLWNLLNALPLLWAILHLPVLDGQRRCWVGWFVLLELLISLQNSQSNGLMAAFVLLTWISIEHGSAWQAAGWAAAGGFLKIFGFLAAVPALVYPYRSALIGWGSAWTVVLLALPLAVVSPEQLVRVYEWWIALLRADHEASVGLSLMGWLQAWFGWQPPKLAVVLVGLALLLFSAWAVWRRRGADGLPPAQDRAYLWASALLWMVLFNHKAESPTFIIALCGVAVWYWSTLRPTRWMQALLWVAFVMASLSPSDLFPPVVRTTVVQPYVLKAVPCIFIWLLLTAQLCLPFRRQSANK
ncbi:MAG: glycosyltransferase family 87 protein [Saprospiraceae bacterium]|nr:DUF2029 domain-containing protein [Saprospiraceae bacterium]MDW8230274.1 glycosyltransferase family 87 protein [Saprospiraceae bacterium]